jgi:hypothetical protein
MKAEREWLDPAKRSILAKTSPDSVIDVFSFILPIYYAGPIHANKVAPARSCGFALGTDPERWLSAAVWAPMQHGMPSRPD